MPIKTESMPFASIVHSYKSIKIDSQRIKEMKGAYILKRHFNIARGKNPTRKWHIDYLLSNINVDCAILIPTEKAIECSLSRNLNDMKDIRRISGFGCSDCFCDAHLFYAENEMKNKIIDICNIFGKSIVMNYEIS